MSSRSLFLQVTQTNKQGTSSVPWHRLTSKFRFHFPPPPPNLSLSYWLNRYFFFRAVFAQVCLRLPTIKSRSKIHYFITQHNAAVARDCCIWHVDCRNIQLLSIHYYFVFFYHCCPKSVSTSNQPQNCRQLCTAAQDHQILHLHQGLHLTVVHRRNPLGCANPHIWWHLSPWKGVLLLNPSFSRVVTSVTEFPPCPHTLYINQN